MGTANTVIYPDMGMLDDWLLKQAINQAESGISIEEQRIPQTVEHLGQPHIYLYATLIFEGEVANGGMTQFFENSTGALGPTVLDALREMGLGHDAVIMTQLIAAFGPAYPSNQLARLEVIDENPVLKDRLEHDYIDVWGIEFINARNSYARKHRLLK